MCANLQLSAYLLLLYLFFFSIMFELKSGCLNFLVYLTFVISSFLEHAIRYWFCSGCYLHSHFSFWWKNFTLAIIFIFLFCLKFLQWCKYLSRKILYYSLCIYLKLATHVFHSLWLFYQNSYNQNWSFIRMTCSWTENVLVKRAAITQNNRICEHIFNILTIASI